MKGTKKLLIIFLNKGFPIRINFKKLKLIKSLNDIFNPFLIHKIKRVIVFSKTEMDIIRYTSLIEIRP